MIRIWCKSDQVVVKIEARIPKSPVMICTQYGALDQPNILPPAMHSKEGNEGLHCTTRWLNNWPNIMIQVGNPEPPLSSVSTRNDGHSSGCAESLYIEIWQLRLSNRRQTHRSPEDIQTATQAGSYSRRGHCYPHRLYSKDTLFYLHFF